MEENKSVKYSLSFENGKYILTNEELAEEFLGKIENSEYEAYEDPDKVYKKKMPHSDYNYYGDIEFKNFDKCIKYITDKISPDLAQCFESVSPSKHGIISFTVEEAEQFIEELKQKEEKQASLIEPCNVELFNAFKSVYKFDYLFCEDFSEQKDYWVYEWYIKETGKPFYVGYGLKNETTIEKYNSDKLKKIKDAYEIDYRIIAENFDELNAIIFQICRILQYKKERLYIINKTGSMTTVYDDKGKIENDDGQKHFNDDDNCGVFIDSFTKYFFPTKKIDDYHFDEDITIEDLSSVSFFPSSFLGIKNESLISEWLISHKSTIEKTPKKDTKCIIILSGFEMSAYAFDTFKEKGKKIFTDKKVLEFIDNIPKETEIKFTSTRKIRLPKYNKENRIIVHKFLEENSQKIFDLAESSFFDGKDISDYHDTFNGIYDSENEIVSEDTLQNLTISIALVYYQSRTIKYSLVQLPQLGRYKSDAFFKPQFEFLYNEFNYLLYVFIYRYGLFKEALELVDYIKSHSPDILSYEKNLAGSAAKKITEIEQAYSFAEECLKTENENK